MPRVLVIDDDVGTLVTYKAILRAAGYEVATAALGEDGLASAQRDPFDVVVCDHRLPDRTGIDITHEISQTCPHTAIVVVTGWGTPDLILEAKRAGATNYAAKPLIGDELVSVVEEALRLHVMGVAATPGAGYAARRWCELIIRGVYLPDDPKTIAQWCRGIAVAQGTLKKRCDVVHVSPKDSLDLLRLIRVVIQSPDKPWDLPQRLNIVDGRTVHSLMRRSGFSDCLRTPNLESFLSGQQLILRSELIDALRSRLLRTLTPNTAVTAQL